MTLRGRIPMLRASGPDPADGCDGVQPTWWEMQLAQQRTCARCGASTLFFPSDPTGDWFRCGRCGRFA
jgi:ribosomal protein S27AE